MRNQASELQRIFGQEQESLAVHAICCPQRAAAVPALMQSLCYRFSERGATVAWVDEVEIAQRENWPLLRNIRHDLWHGMAKTISLSACLLPISHHADDTTASIWYGFGPQISEQSDLVQPLAERLLKSGVPFDLLLVGAAAQAVRLWAAYGRTFPVTLISSPGEHALEQIAEWINENQQFNRPAPPFGIFLCGQPDECSNHFKKLQQAAELIRGIRLKYVGSADIDLFSENLTTMWSTQATALESIQSYIDQLKYGG
jgi:hypothetical protein